MLARMSTSEGQTTTHHCISEREGKVEVTKLLIKYNANVNVNA